MRITLTRTGGIIPITKQAELEVDFDEKEMKELLTAIKMEEDSPGSMRDNTTYELSYNAGSYTVNLEKLPAKYEKTFDELKSCLKIVKR